jgi:hypothetical protein
MVNDSPALASPTQGAVTRFVEKPADAMRWLVAWITIGIVFSCLLWIESAWSASPLDDCLARKECKFLVWRGAHPPAQMAFAVLASQWTEFTLEEKADIERRLEAHLEAMKNNPELYAQSKEFGAGISSGSLMLPMIVRNIRRANRHTILIGHMNNDELYIDSELAGLPR